MTLIRLPSRPAARRPALGVVAGCLALALVACGSTGSPQQPASSPGSAGTSTSQVPSGPRPSLSAGPTDAGPTGAGAVTTVQGTVTEGVEGGCGVLVDASGAVVANLQAWDLAAHPFESVVEVTGTFEPDLMTTCQQGTPFEVITATSR